MLATLFLSLALLFPQPQVVDATILPGNVDAVLTFSDGSMGIASLASMASAKSLNDVPVTMLTIAVGPPVRHTLEYESAVGTIRVDIDCRTYNTQQGCIDAFADAVRRMQTAFPRVVS